MRRRVPIALVVLLIALVGIIAWQVCRLHRPRAADEVTFRGKSLDAWFYGSRTNFLSKTTRDDAQKAFDGVGTNAFPFLISKLSAKTGNKVSYQKAYRSMPLWIRDRLLYPISDDEVKSVALHHLWVMNKRIPGEEFQALVDSVPRLSNPRLRLRCLKLLNWRFQADPVFKRLCTELLNDPDSAIRLEAAIPLGESAILADPAESRLFPILISAMENKEVCDYYLRINGNLGRSGPYVADPNEVLRSRISVALIRLKPYLTAEQRARLDKVNGGKPKDLVRPL